MDKKRNSHLDNVAIAANKIEKLYSDLRKECINFIKNALDEQEDNRIELSYSNGRPIFNEDFSDIVNTVYLDDEWNIRIDFNNIKNASIESISNNEIVHLVVSIADAAGYKCLI